MIGKAVFGGGRRRGSFYHTYEDIISVDNLLEAWQEFLSGKRKKKDVQIFSLNLMEYIFNLHASLKNNTYQHGPYHAFQINDPKPRKIHKSSVRDRLLHHAVYRILYPFFDRKFISDSYSCRLDKGTHRAMNRFRRFTAIVSRNHTRTCWILKCDIRKFFENIDHEILLSILGRYIEDINIMNLLGNIVHSFSTVPGRGLPLGNLTSQLFVNIYMNEFDQVMKHVFKVKHYIRYADDFVILSEDRDWLLHLLPKLRDYLSEELKLDLHPDKIFIKTGYSGMDFLGWVHFLDHRVLRTTTKKRMFRRITEVKESEATIRSYRGLLSHGNTWKLKKLLLEFNR